MNARATPRQPTSIVVHQLSRTLEVGFDDGRNFRIPFEPMRIYSPSAEVQGHGPGQEVLQTGKREAELTALEPVGNYAVQPRFSDGHESGLFSWGLPVLSRLAAGRSVEAVRRAPGEEWHEPRRADGRRCPVVLRSLALKVM